MEGKLTPGLFERAAERVGLVSRILNTSSSNLDSNLLPAVLLCQDGSACVLMGSDGGSARVIFPSQSRNSSDPKEIPLEELETLESGQVIVCRPRFKFDDRAPKLGEDDRGHWFWDAIKANIPVYKDVLVAAFFINLFGLAFPIFFRNVFDRVVPNYAVETLWVLTSGLMLVFVADFLLRTLRAYFIDLANRRVDIKLSAKIMERVLGMRLEARPSSVGSYAVHLRSFESLRDFIASSSVTALVDLPFALIFLLVIGLIAWQIMLCLVVAAIAMVVYAYFVQAKMRELSETTYRSGALRNSTLIEGLVGLETIKAMGGESRIQRKWEDSTAFNAHVGIKLRAVSNSMGNFTLFAQNMARLFSVVIGVYLIVGGALTMGGLIACHLLAARALAPFARVAGILLQYHQAKVSLQNLDEVMNTPMEHPEGSSFISREQFKGDIRFKDVSFSYPGSEMEALSNLTFRIRAGEKVAILGRMGSGKSTIQKLCMGLFAPTSGSVLIDGIDLRQLDLTEYRAQVGYVPQEVTLFYGSLRENLVLTDANVTDDDLLRAARVADLLGHVNRHPKGFDMQVGERGESLSGGQRKSAAVARALVHDPGILLMDEPTGSMDNSTETTVKRRLGRYIEGRTFVIVTHRTSMLDLVDRIIVLDNGKMVADGPKEQVTEALRQGKIGKAR